jgi:hypothetical protein
LGIEADLSGLVSIGTNTCLASSGFFVSANCRSEPNASATVTPRIGYAIDPQQRTLLYIKGGFAAVHDHIDIASNAILGPGTDASGNVWKAGWTAGAGVERALIRAWSLRLEYDYLGFGHSNVATPISFLQVVPDDAAGYVQTPAGTTSISQNVQEVKFGLNYRFGVDPWARWRICHRYQSQARHGRRQPLRWLGLPAGNWRPACATGTVPANSRRIWAGRHRPPMPTCWYPGSLMTRSPIRGRFSHVSRARTGCS